MQWNLAKKKINELFEYQQQDLQRMQIVLGLSYEIGSRSIHTGVHRENDEGLPISQECTSSNKEKKWASWEGHSHLFSLGESELFLKKEKKYSRLDLIRQQRLTKRKSIKQDSVSNNSINARHPSFQNTEEAKKKSQNIIKLDK